MRDERATLGVVDAETLRLARACIAQYRRWLAEGFIPIASTSGPTTNPVCVKYGAGAIVAVDVKCPNWNCRERAAWHGSAEVANDYGVREVRPKRCPHCGVLGKVERVRSSLA